MAPRKTILIAGIGNIFFGDDGFGSYVARRLAERPFSESTRVVDFGIRGLDLAYELTSGYDLAILIDVTPQGGPPGTLYTIEPESTSPASEEDPGAGLVDAHRMEPASVLRIASQIGEVCPRILLVGCEPAEFGGEDGSMDLSPAVQGAVNDACALVESLVVDFLDDLASLRVRDAQWSACGGASQCFCRLGRPRRIALRGSRYLILSTKRRFHRLLVADWSTDD
jgi:hydrogenase maturation protease